MSVVELNISDKVKREIKKTLLKQKKSNYLILM